MATSDREIRVFISSTFRDMMRERDLLVKTVFPELRRKCARRFVTLTEVDLRWGITEEQANEGRVLPLCLAEIERSRPYFIGLLGERYGWIPDMILPVVIEREPWLQEHVGGRTSVTELEILHGVLRNPNMEDHAFFYFRDPAYINDPEVTEDERRDMLERNIKAEVEEYGEAEASRRTEERREKLANLKERIHDSGFPLVNPYANPRALAEIIRKQFDELIDRLYPEDETPDPLAQERLAHGAHAKNKLFACIDRPKHLKALHDFAASTEHGGQGLVVTGASGGGKTSLLAAWALDWGENHTADNQFLLEHYFGATPDSTSPEGFLRRLLGELKSRFEITDDIPTDPAELRDALPVWLAQTVGHGQIVIVLDGLNQVQGSEPDRSLRFLPRHFPPNVTVLAASLPGPALEALRERGWAEHDLPLATEAEVDAMVGKYLTIHARTLEAALRRALVSAPGSKNPLYLRAVLEELRQFGSFEKLPDRVRHYLEADYPRELFLRILARWQEDFDGKDSEGDMQRLDLVRRALIHLWAARQGLSEPEWLDLLGDGDAPLPRALWSPLFFAMEPHLSQRGSLYTFGHDFLRDSVMEIYLQKPERQIEAHTALADYFERSTQRTGITPRAASEWPFHLRSVGAWDDLEEILTDISMFLALADDAFPLDLIGYWGALIEEGRAAGPAYQKSYDKWLKLGNDGGDYTVCQKIAEFLLVLDDAPSARPFVEFALESCRKLLGPEHSYTLRAQCLLGSLAYQTFGFKEAQKILGDVLAKRSKTLGALHADTLACANDLGLTLMGLGNLGQARKLHEQTLSGRRETLGPRHDDTVQSMVNLALVLARQGLWKEGMMYNREALRIRQSTMGLSHPKTLMIMINLADDLGRKGEHEEAISLIENALSAGQDLLGKEHPMWGFMKLSRARQLALGGGREIEAEAECGSVIETVLRASMSPKRREDMLIQAINVLWLVFDRSMPHASKIERLRTIGHQSGKAEYLVSLYPKSHFGRTNKANGWGCLIQTIVLGLAWWQFGFFKAVLILLAGNLFIGMLGFLFHKNSRNTIQVMWRRISKNL